MTSLGGGSERSIPVRGIATRPPSPSIPFKLMTHSFESFVHWVKSSVNRFPPLVELVALFFALQDPKTPAWAKAILASTLAYILSPLDLIPDPLPGGLVDDIAVLFATLSGVAGAFVTEEHRAKAREFLGIPN